MKWCTQCHNRYPATAEYFHREPRVKGGLTASCKTCKNKQVLGWAKRVGYYSKSWRRRGARGRQRSVEAAMRWKKKNPEKVAAYQKKYNAKNPGRKRELDRASQERACLNLSRSYIKKLLIGTSGLRYSDIPEELVEIKRAQVKLFRKIEEVSHGERTNQHSGIESHPS